MCFRQACISRTYTRLVKLLSRIFKRGTIEISIFEITIGLLRSEEGIFTEKARDKEKKSAEFERLQVGMDFFFGHSESRSGSLKGKLSSTKTDFRRYFRSPPEWNINGGRFFLSLYIPVAFICVHANAWSRSNSCGASSANSSPRWPPSNFSRSESCHSRLVSFLFLLAIKSQRVTILLARAFSSSSTRETIKRIVEPTLPERSVKGSSTKI